MIIAVFTRGYCIRNFMNIPKDSGSFVDHSVDFIILNRLSGQKCHLLGQNYLNLHYLYETICKKLYNRATDRRNFRNVSGSFGNEILHENGQCVHCLGTEMARCISKSQGSSHAFVCRMTCMQSLVVIICCAIACIR